MLNKRRIADVGSNRFFSLVGAHLPGATNLNVARQGRRTSSISPCFH